MVSGPFDSMTALLWFLIGSATTLAITLAVVARARKARDAGVRVRLADLERRANEPKLEHRTLVIEESRSLDQLARVVGSELATLASGVEGHAQLLCEGIGEPALVATRAERLWVATRRVRFFAEKVQSFAKRESIVLGPVSLRALLSSLREELEHHVGRPLGITIESPQLMPQALAERQALQYAALFAIEALLALDATARRLVLRAGAGYADQESASGEDRVHVAFELHGEEPLSVHEGATHGDEFQLAWVAAKNLLDVQRADLSLDEEPGLVTSATITLHTCAEPEHAGEAPRELSADARTKDRPALREPHAFAGALIVENDPSVRDLLAEEVGRAGRKPVTLGDAAAARALFERTPERFELLVLATENRLSPNELLAAVALTQNADLRVAFVGPDERVRDRVPDALRSRTHFLRKPFGALEVRNVLAELADASMIPLRSHAIDQPAPTLSPPPSRDP